tara:strand:+ start:218 stop:469 length:252 start_codon:yes stop_codon:yes gene_type:complete
MSSESENEKGKLSYEERCFKWASNFYLYEELPDEFFEMDEASQEAHLVSRAWEPFEGTRGYTLYGHIEDLADHIIEKTYPASE